MEVSSDLLKTIKPICLLIYIQKMDFGVFIIEVLKIYQKMNKLFLTLQMI
jgi:hypothetical protein